MLDLKSAPLSPARRAGDFLFLSGQVAFDKQGQMAGQHVKAQTDQVFRNIEAILSSNGATLENVVNVNVILKKALDFPAFNSAYAAYFPDIKPTRPTVIGGLLAGALVEITVTAWLGK